MGYYKTVHTLEVSDCSLFICSTCHGNRDRLDPLDGGVSGLCSTQRKIFSALLVITKEAVLGVHGTLCTLAALQIIMDVNHKQSVSTWLT